ncbi:hypothetical protein HDU83_005442 [Entophlyctis luteolus]|nr:hypothetical protein HDU82_000083 [Entophlyctis luteolus]KAJ3343967.1 hypothetical protein HDU83_005442 [Entophlyctis luteolus]KAJ3381861.1 hypothetical protein HDU84_004780 [Entophlyctis sp. JEL0112]
MATYPAAAGFPLAVTSAVFTCVGALQVGVFAGFVAWCERDTKVATPFNVSLSLIGLGNIGIFGASTLLHYAESGSTQRRAAQLVGQFCSALVQAAYTYYCYKRAAPVVEAAVPSAVNIVSVLFKGAPVVLFPQVIPYIILLCRDGDDESLWESVVLGLDGLGALWVIVFDSVLLVAFFKVLRNPDFHAAPTTVTTASDAKHYTPSRQSSKVLTAVLPRRRFVIISKYGATSLACAFFVAGTYVVLNYVSNVEVIVVCYALIYACIASYFGIMFAMKVALHWEKQRSTEEIQVRLEESLGKFELEKIRKRDR